METFGDKARALGLAVGVHLLCVALLVVGLTWTRAARPVNVAGPIIEATLVSYAPPKTPVSRTKPQPPKPQPVTPPKVEPKVETKAPELPPVPPRAEDRRNQERVDRNALEKSETAEREQEEKRKREQEVLEQEERMTEMERERQQQLEDIRKLRLEAEKRRMAEQVQLAKLVDKQKQAQREVEKKRMQELLDQEQVQAGTEGTDDDLAGRYALAIQNAVEDNWTRPDTAAPGVRCQLAITQIPGGEVIEAHVSGPCNADDLTRRSIEAAVLKAQPLPYQGYETVFSRTITFNFRYDG